MTFLIGVAASAFTSAALVPQLYKIIKEKKAEGTSLGMLIVLFTGLVLWIIYGILKDDWIIIVANAISLVINVSVGVLTIKYKYMQNQ
jgi:MtN3 and saliva related transmembrane protein